MSYDQPVDVRVTKALEKYTIACDFVGAEFDQASLDAARQALAHAMAEEAKVQIRHGMVTEADVIAYDYKDKDPLLLTLYKEECAKIMTATEFRAFHKEINNVHAILDEAESPATVITDHGKLHGGGLPPQANAHHGAHRH